MLFPSVKGRFARTAELKNVFHPVKGPFARTADVSTSFPSVERQFRYRSQQRTPFGRERKISGCIAGSQEGPASSFRNPKNTFEHQPHSTAFYEGCNLKVYETSVHL